MGGEVLDRIVVVESVYHQPFGAEASAVESRFTRRLKTVEQVYVRQSSVGEEWQPLDHGWIKECGMLVVQNNEGRALQVNLADDEREALSKKVLEIAYLVPKDLTAPAAGRFLILPGESIRVHPSPIEKLHVRSQSGIARFTVNAFPR